MQNSATRPLPAKEWRATENAEVHYLWSDDFLAVIMLFPQTGKI
jgi:hypothetical protein